MSSFLNKGLSFNVEHLSAMVFGGPFVRYVPGTRRLFAVKMAAEIDHPHNVSVPTEDFGVPSYQDMTHGVLQAIEAIYDGNDVYVGCRGGLGRTGLFMGCMAKVMIDYNRSLQKDYEGTDDPVVLVRAQYKPYAIETQEQLDFVRGYDTGPALELLSELIGPKVVEVDRVVTVKEVRYVGMLGMILSWLGFPTK